ncbi:unnamed protein product [Caenorhabditis angaria]|uniref:Uncharacterized protein n=1 Tax=Caenorhabditis angaria TaxID=860376 RepID=A0A9P1N885_9PELO|nr:unnamed protein product [Caenorhabditis angaria]
MKHDKYIQIELQNHYRQISKWFNDLKSNANTEKFDAETLERYNKLSNDYDNYLVSAQRKINCFGSDFIGKNFNQQFDEVIQLFTRARNIYNEVYEIIYITSA